MFNLDILVSHQQIQYIPQDQHYIKLDHIPLVNSIWFVIGEERNVVLSYDTYDGYNFHRNEDIKINYIKEPNTIYNSPVPNLNYLDIDSDKDIIKKYIGCLVNTICTDFTIDESSTESEDESSNELIIREKYLLKSDIYYKNGIIKPDAIDKYLKNLCGKCFIDWSSSEQIKNKISGKTIQINYWYHPEK